MEGEVVDSSGKGNTYQGGDSSNLDLHNVLFLSCLRGLSRRLKPSLGSSGGVTGARRGRSIGLVGRSFVSQKTKVVWGFKN